MTINLVSHGTLVNFLKDQKTEFHTFQLKEDIPNCVVIYILHTITLMELIKSELDLKSDKFRVYYIK